ncbi:MAG: GatB/YqeY domain-containing protein [Clostridiales bacterium]|nr:GatB/YqeY domain-containing protein [Clostridiales bacterium]
MPLMDRLNEDMKAAMKAKEEGKLKLSVIRMIKSAVKYQEIDNGDSLDDDGVTTVIARELKQRREVLPEYEKNGRHDMVRTLEEEIAVLMDYLPRQLDESELRAMIAETIEETGAAGPKDMGKVMGKISAATKGKADGRMVSDLVKDALAKLTPQD